LPVEAHSTDLMPSPLRCIAALCLIIAVALYGLVQDQPASPELTKLSRYLGTWTYDGEDKTASDNRRVTCRTVRQWIAGGAFVESRRDCSTPHGNVTQLEVFGYDFGERRYMYWGFNGRFVSTYVTSAIDGATITWTGIGWSSSNRCTESFANDFASSIDRCETSVKGVGSCRVVAQGKSTKLP
jgi:hypothetical protein